MKFLEQDGMAFIDTQTKLLITCPLKSRQCDEILCLKDCAYNHIEKDRTSNAMNVFCKDYLLGILEEK